MRNILFIIFGLIILGCSKQSDKKDVWVSMNYMGDIDSLAELVMQGDSNAFDKLDIGTMAEELNGSAILPYAFMMADKYHYSRAYFLVYWKLVSVYSVGCFEVDSINTIPEQTRNLALEYLKKGMEAGEYNSVRDWNELVEKKLIDPSDYK